MYNPSAGCVCSRCVVCTVFPVPENHTSRKIRTRQLLIGSERNDRASCVQVRDSRGRRVGRCKEWAKVVGDDQVDAHVLAMRHKDLPYVPKLQKASKPERVMTYRSVTHHDMSLVCMGAACQGAAYQTVPTPTLQSVLVMS